MQSSQMMFALLLTTSLGVVSVEWAVGLEGELPKEIQDKANEEEFNCNFVGVKASFLAAAINEKRLVKVGLDPVLAAKSFKDIDFSGRNILQSVFFLADKLEAKTFVIGDFIHICKELPPGVKASKSDAQLVVAPGALSKFEVVFPGLNPGDYRKLPWLIKPPKECQEDLKPVMLFIHDARYLYKKEDEKPKNNAKALFFEMAVLNDPTLKDAFKDWNLIMIDSENKDWPEAVRKTADNGFALYMMTCDLKPQFSLVSKAAPYKMMTPKILADKAADVNRSNVLVAKQVAQKLQEGKKVAVDKPETPEGAQEKDPKDPKEKGKKASEGMGGVLGGDNEEGKAEAKKPEPPKKPKPPEKVEDEEE